MGVIEEEEEEGKEGEESLFEEIVAEIFPTLGKATDIQIQETQWSKLLNLKRFIPHKLLLI